MRTLEAPTGRKVTFSSTDELDAAIAVTAIIDAAGLRESEVVPLVTICVELVERGHECKLVVGEGEERRAAALAEGVVTRADVGDEIRKMVVVTTKTSVARLLASAPLNQTVGVCDLIFGRRAAEAFEEAGVPFFCTFGGLASTLAVVGVLPAVVAPQTCFSAWFRKQAIILTEDVSAQRLLQETTEAARREDALRTYEAAQNCFVASFEDCESPAFWNFLTTTGSSGGKTKKKKKLRFAKCFGPPKVVPLKRESPFFDFLATAKTNVVVVQVGTEEDGGLTPAGMLAIFEGLRAVRDGNGLREEEKSLGVIWRVSNARLFRQTVKEAPDWLLAVEDASLPLPSLLAHPAVRCLVSDCAWTDATDALRAGVPVLAAPISHEQQLNALKLAQLGVAVCLDGGLDAGTDALFFAAPTAPDIRTPERFTARLVARAAATLLFRDFQQNARLLQLAHFKHTRFGAALVADTIEAHFDFAAGDLLCDDDLFDCDDLTGGSGDDHVIKLTNAKYAYLDDDDDPFDDDDILCHVVSAKHPKCHAFSCTNLFASSSSSRASSSNNSPYYGNNGDLPPPAATDVLSLPNH